MSPVDMGEPENVLDEGAETLLRLKDWEITQCTLLIDEQRKEIAQLQAQIAAKYREGYDNGVAESHITIHQLRTALQAILDSAPTNSTAYETAEHALEE